jgi:hypothetical protein
MAKRKPKVVDATIVYKEGEESLSVFGWCSTEYHEACIVEFPGHKCKCECHGGSDEQSE